MDEYFPRCSGGRIAYADEAEMALSDGKRCESPQRQNSQTCHWTVDDDLGAENIVA